jgi:hypothetical protein
LWVGQLLERMNQLVRRPRINSKHIEAEPHREDDGKGEGGQGLGMMAAGQVSAHDRTLRHSQRNTEHTGILNRTQRHSNRLLDAFLVPIGSERLWVLLAWSGRHMSCSQRERQGVDHMNLECYNKPSQSAETKTNMKQSTKHLDFLT